MQIPALVRHSLVTLEHEEDAVVQLVATRTVTGWLREAESELLRLARAQGRTWEEIGSVQERPRQAVHRQAKTPIRPHVKGLTTPEFDGIGTPDLRYWLKWWRDPKRSRDGVREASRDPVAEQQKIEAELDARERAGVAGPARHTTWSHD